MTINDKIRDEKLQYGIDSEAAKISALSSRLYVLVMSRTRLRVNPHSTVA